MASKFSQIQDGLSQRDRAFPELERDYFAMDSMSQKSILEMMKKYAVDHGMPHFFDGVDLSNVINMMNGEADGKTDPAVALYAVCAKLMGHVQEKINELPNKRVDFYYRQILKEDNLPAEGDHAYVTFDVENEGFDCVIPQGTRFEAGENSQGETVEFESVADAPINDVKVAKILTASWTNGYPVTQTEIPVYGAKEASEIKMEPRPLFGLTRSNELTEETAFSDVGVCVSNRILYMQSGIRNVKMTFCFAPDSIRETVIEKNFATANGFSAAFSNAFKLSITSEQGWLEIPEYRIGNCNLNSECPENQITVDFTIEDSAPAIENYNPEIHGENYSFKHPVFRLLMNARKSQALWNAFMKAQLQKVCISTDVKKCRNIVASNEYGPVSTLAPVQLFGAVPSLGSSFIFGSSEVCGKKLNSLRLHGKWCGLPNCENLKDWYSQYENPPQTSDFKVSLNALYSGEWFPIEKNAVTCPLFEENKDLSDDEGGISSDFKLSFSSIVCSRTSENFSSDENFMYSPLMKDGFFRIKLISPAKAFLHREISKTVSNSFLAQVFKKKGVESLPNQPYTPSVEDLYVDYTSYAESSVALHEFELDSGIVFVHPFGFSCKESFRLTNGALYLGLKFSGKPKKVNLYFVLNRDSENHGNGIGKFQWAYLGSNRWKPLPEENRLSDSTANFTSSGIVSLALPNDMQNDGHLMPKGFVWIRINPTENNWRECARILSVFSQTLEVKRVSGFEKGNVLRHLKPKTIKELTQSFAGLSGVFQLEESFGGKARESDSKMRTRVAEFLLHRNQCVNVHDYERVILEHFPEVYKVKCFPHMKIDISTGHYDCSSPGNLLVVPVAPLFADGSFQMDPCLDGSVVREIREFLQNRIPGFAHVQVFNPFFDKIQVRCNVRFQSGKNEGKMLLDLNEKINRFLSPWFPQDGGIVDHFGWKLEKEALKAYIESLDYIEYVGDDFTIMKIASTDEQKFFVNLFENTDNKILHGSCPWSIPVPMKKHFINDIDDSNLLAEDNVNNGYGGLEIGQTFIIRKS